MKILIVEDDLPLGDMLKESLEILDHEKVRVCTTGRSGLEAVQDEAYGCVFVDLKLPDMIGTDLLDKIKKHDPMLPVVMMSGFPTMDYTIQSMRSGASDFLTKPFSLQNLVLTLERITKERALLMENLALKLESQTRKQLEIVNRQLELRIREQVELFEISRQIDEIRNSDGLYRHMVELRSTITGSEGAALFFFTPEKSHLMCISHSGNGRVRELFRPLVSVSREQLAKLGLESERSSITADAIGSLQIRTFYEGTSTTQEDMYWPIRIRGELFGILALASCPNGRSLEASKTKLVDFLVRKASLVIENLALYENLMANFCGILKSLISALEARDPYTGKHSERVTQYAVRTAEVMGRHEAQIEVLKTAGHLHDIGKMGIADHILNKAGPLTGDEYEIIKQHPVIGESIVSELGLGPEERAVILHHHERWDGTGYPHGLAGPEIPMVARIIAVADAFDAMTSKRAYRSAMSSQDAVRELMNNSGKQFDPQVVDIFSHIISENSEP